MEHPITSFLKKNVSVICGVEVEKEKGNSKPTLNYFESHFVHDDDRRFLFLQKMHRVIIFYCLPPRGERD
jgi:hypothetical protein